MLENRWFVLAVLFITRFALGYQFQSAGSVAPFLIHQLNIDYTKIGMLVAVFFIPGAAISIPSGYLARNLGDKKVVLGGLVLMIAGGLFSGVAESYGLLFAGRVLSGTGGAILVVVMSKMVADWFARRELFLGMAIFIIGWPVGIAAAQATQSRLAELHSWHMVFIASAALVALALLLMMFFYRSPPDPGRSATAGRAQLTGLEVAVISLAGIIWMSLNAAYLIMLSFGPARLIELHVPVVRSYSIVSLMSWVFVFALPLGGYLASRYRVPNLVMIGGLAASVLLGTAIPYSPAPMLTFALFGTALALATPIVGSLPAEVLEPRLRGPGFGLYYLWYFAGTPILIPIAGLLRDKTGSVTASLMFGTALMLCCLVLSVAFRSAQARWFAAESV